MAKTCPLNGDDASQGGSIPPQGVAHGYVTPFLNHGLPMRAWGESLFYMTHLTLSG